MEPGTSSAFLAGKNWPFQRTQEELASRAGTSDGASGFGPPSSVLQLAGFDNAVGSLRDPKTFASITAKQAEWERQLESADQRTAELSHFQWNLIREQLSTLSREMATMRQDNETLRSSEQRREVREADFARVVRETQAELEKENLSRRKDGEELSAGLHYVKQVLENERSDRSQAMKAIERDVAEQLQNVKVQQRQQLEADKDLSSRFEHWCMELRATLDKESSVRGQKLNELEQVLLGTVQKVDKETRDRAESIEEISNMQMADRESSRLIPDLSQSISQLKANFEEGEFMLRKEDLRQMESAFRSMEAEVSSLQLALDGECTERRAMGESLQNLQRLVELSAKDSDFQVQRQNIDERMSHLADTFFKAAEVSEHNTELKGELAKLSGELDNLTQRVAEEIERGKEQNDKQHQAHLERHTQLDERLSNRFNADEERIEDLRSVVSASESRIAQVANQWFEEVGLVPRSEFDQAVQRMWEAIDTHTHDIDVAALTSAQSVQEAEHQAPSTTQMPSPTQVSRVLMSQPGPSRSRTESSVTLSPKSTRNLLQQRGMSVRSSPLSWPVPMVATGSGSLTLPVGTATAPPQTPTVPPNLVMPQTPAVPPNMVIMRFSSQPETPLLSQVEVKQQSLVGRSPSSPPPPAELQDASTPPLVTVPLPVPLVSAVAAPLTPSVTQMRLPIRSRSITPVRR